MIALCRLDGYVLLADFADHSMLHILLLERYHRSKTVSTLPMTSSQISRLFEIQIESKATFPTIETALSVVSTVCDYDFQFFDSVLKRLVYPAQTPSSSTKSPTVSSPSEAALQIATQPIQTTY